MRFTRLAVIAAAVCVAGSSPLAQRQLQILATVTDPNGAAVATLDPAAVRVTENGVEGKILKVEPLDREPKVQILIDNGLGMPQESLGDLRTGLRGLLEALPPDVEVTLVTTAPQPRFLERATKDRQKLLDSVNRLTPDTGAGRFIESLHEATDRIERDKTGRYTIVSVATASGDTDVRERDVQQIMQRVPSRGTTVHVILLTSPGRTASGGFVQGEVGQAVSKGSGGRFENIAVANRVATLLPEIGAQMAKSLGGSSRQFRITVERPGGASGDLGKMGLGIAGMLVADVSIESQ